MTRTTLFAALFALAALPESACAQNSDIQVWTTQTTVVAVNKSTTATLDLSGRFREQAAGGDLLLVRGSLDVRLDKALSLGGGVSLIETSGPTEYRPYEQMVLTAGAVSLRTQLEERFVDGAARMGLRLRERVQLREPLGPRDRVIASAEALIPLRQTNPVRRLGPPELRFALSEQHSFGKHISATLGYLLIDQQHAGTPDHYSHVPQLTLTWRP